MPKCNLFNTLEQENGTFYMFSEYVNDVTQESTQQNYRNVVPSKYAVLNINIEKFLDTANLPNGDCFKYIDENNNEVSLLDEYKSLINDQETGYNRCKTDYDAAVESGIPEDIKNAKMALDAALNKVLDALNKVIGNLFQGYYENSVSFLRKNLIDTPNENDPDKINGISSVMLWHTLLNSGLITVEHYTGNDEFDYIPEINYIGDIDLYSNNVVDGLGYNELQITIDATASKRKYDIDDTDGELDAIIGDFIKYNNSLNTASDVYNRFIDGFNDNNYPINAILSDNAFFVSIDNDEQNNLQGFYGNSIGNFEAARCPVKLLYKTASNMIGTDTIYNDGQAHYVDDTTENKFLINAVICFYDIVSYDKNLNKTTLYYNKPMGIYFTGSFINNDENCNCTVANEIHPVLKNTITKYVSNGEIYDNGSSYSLRIITKYSNTVNSTNLTEEIATQSSTELVTLSQLYDKIGETITKAQQIIANNLDYQNSLMSVLQSIKDGSQNVPYIQEYAGTDYWYVNGRKICEVWPNNATNSLRNIIQEEIANALKNSVITVSPSFDPATSGYVGSIIVQLDNTPTPNNGQQTLEQ